MTGPEYRDVDTVETERYVKGGQFDEGGGSYPYTIAPDETIKVLHITDAGNIVAACDLVNGDTVQIPMAGGVGIIDWLEIDAVEFQDPNGTGARIAGSWAGE
jgi:hypothetical protein